MKIGPQKTDTAKFSGFGMSMKAGGSAGSSAPGRPQGNALAGGMVRGSAAQKAKAASGGMASLFRETMDEPLDPVSKQAQATMQWSKPTLEAMKAQREAEALLAVDPTAFQYDEVIDDEKRSMDIEVPSQQVRTDVLTQKKKVGLVLREGHEMCKSGAKRDPKYIEKVINVTDRRKVEQQIVEDRLLKKEQNAREGREIFVTEAFKDELKRRKKFEDELEEAEAKDERLDATKMENGKGFADFHRSLLNGGMSSSRGAAIAGKELTKVECDDGKKSAVLVQDPNVKKEEPEEEEEDVKKEAVKMEEPEENAEKEHGVQDVEAEKAATTAKAAKAAAEAEERAEKAMSAKERYLARKRKAAESAA